MSMGPEVGPLVFFMQLFSPKSVGQPVDSSGGDILYGILKNDFFEEIRPSPACYSTTARREEGSIYRGTVGHPVDFSGGKRTGEIFSMIF